MIIVTGAGGFIGHYIAEELGKTYSVLRVGTGSKWQDESYHGFRFLDVKNPGDFKPPILPQTGITAVIHCAAFLMIDNHQPKDYFLTNSLGTYNVLEYCRKVGARLIYLSTHSDMNASKKITITENDQRDFIGQTPNAAAFIASKIAACEMIESYNRARLVEGVIFRIANVRGFKSKDTEYNSVFHQFIAKAKVGSDIEIWGKHKTIRDLIYVRDVARAVKMALDRARPGLYNIGSGIGLTIEDEARGIIDVFSPKDNPSKIIYRPDIEEIRKHSCIFNIDKAREEFGWQPIYTYQKGLEDMKEEMKRGEEVKLWV